IVMSRAAVGLALVLAVVGMMVGGTIGSSAATAAVAVVLIAPLARVVWLAARWFRRGDPRYGAVALGVLAVVAGAAVLAAI
ncbi:MAG TPA: hypothetical protein PLZ72_14910, partial [Microthrixaceae bacterium]|nr:hypothetical protein [Microthrixaceae bacterium]